MNILHMGLMSDAGEWCWLLMAHGGQAILVFGLQLAESLAPYSYQQIWTKSHGICGYETISAAFRSLNILHMGLMSDATELCWLLIACECQAILIFGLWLAESLALISKSGPKVMAFVVMTPYQLPPDL
jgi:hypothetical protein